jgi:hypothetical protein
MLYAENIEATPTLLLPDKNVATRLAHITRDRCLGCDDFPSPRHLVVSRSRRQRSSTSSRRSPFADWPPHRADDAANAELARFKIAGIGRASTWIDLAVGL